MESGLIQYPAEIGSAAKGLISSLLELEPEARLGSNGSREVELHPWFSTVDFNERPPRIVSP